MKILLALAILVGLGAVLFGIAEWARSFDRHP